MWSNQSFILLERDPSEILLTDDEVHVWRASLNFTESSLQSLQHSLAADERSRADRFHFQKDREYFIAARGLLRVILSHYLGIAPSHLRFCYSANGKPALSNHGGNMLRFNLSHSHGLALYAITRYREVGIDLERIRADFPWEDLAQQFFSPQENATLGSLPASFRHWAFFNCWTRKEAYVKATGKGLMLPLDQFDVSLAPGEPAALLRTRWDVEEAARWSLQELIPGPGYVAALAVEGDRYQLKYWQWPTESVG